MQNCLADSIVACEPRRSTLLIATLLVPLVATFIACGRRDAPKATPRATAIPHEWFEDVTDRVGLHFVHSVGAAPTYFMPHIMGSGGALIDYDNDGLLDIYLVQNAGPGSAITNRLFHQELDGTFVDRSAGSGLDVAGYGMGVAVGDINNDGLPDLCLTEYGRTRLFVNRGAGRFEDISAKAGIENTDWGTSASFFDYDRDGWLDLVIVNYVQYAGSNDCADEVNHRDFCGPQSFTGSLPKLFHNLTGQSRDRLEPMRFEDVTHAAGLGITGSRGLGVACNDFTGDGWPDILIANDGQPNRLWVNRHDGTFAEEGMSRGIAVNSMGQPAANMGIAIGDIRGAGEADVAISHLTEEGTTYWSQRKPGAFQDISDAVGIGPNNSGTGFGITFADFDNDGFLDFAVANGRVTLPKLPASVVSRGDSAREFWHRYAESNSLCANRGGGRLENVGAVNPAFCGTPAVSRALLVGDINNDGAVDLLVTRIADTAALYQNVCTNRGHWLNIRAIDPSLGGRDAYGAKVVVNVEGRLSAAWIQPGLGYLGSNDPRAHFGLGDHATVEEIKVFWPDGVSEVFPGGSVDALKVIRRGGGKVIRTASGASH